MDLKSMLNANGADQPKPIQIQPAPPPLPTLHTQPAQPTTPLTTIAPNPYRDFRTPPPVPSGRLHSVHEHGIVGPAPTSAGPYGGSPPPPFAPSYGGRTSVPTQSPYPASDLHSPMTHRPTPSALTRHDSGGYFPAQAGPASPGARQAPPHSSAVPFSQRNGYPQGEGLAHIDVNTGAGPNGRPYSQAGAQGPPALPPQTPPVAVSGGAYPYTQHQRSQSIQSTSTPTSAHSQTQAQYNLPYTHASPTMAQQQIPRPGSGRQSSQPPTPLGPPMSAGQRPSYSTGSFVQPPSPSQQRIFIAASTQAYPQTHPSPAVARPPSASRMSSMQQGYDGSRDSVPRPGSQGERAQSASISPRTRVPSLPSSTGNTASFDSESRHVQPPKHPETLESARDRGVTPAKRKLDDRGMKADELEVQPPRPPHFGTNGSHVPSQADPPVRGYSVSSASAAPPRKKRRFYPRTPVWACHYDGRSQLHAGNFVLRKAPRPHVNGHAEVKGEPSRNASPETARSAGGAAQSQRAAAPGPSAQEEETLALLGPWEPSFNKTRPLEEIPKQIADWLFLDAVQHPALQEIMSRKIKFEVEAKLGTIISRDTNDRIRLPVASEVLLQDDGRLAFRSSMTEAQHKAFNDWFNQLVILTDPRHPDAQAQNRVQVIYQHRREIDRFFELPLALQSRLPGAVRSLMKRNAKVRVTYDQKTRQVLAAIVKVRVSDQHLYFPGLPLDCRFSLNLEMPWPDPVEELERLGVPDAENMPDRNKDRLSYSQSHYQIDLTQVTHSAPGANNIQRPEKEHELEIELDADTMFDQAHRLQAGAPHRFPQLIEGFVDNVRLLARKAVEFSH